MTTIELDWFKSSYSGSSGDDCVEVAVCPDWYKSSYSSSGSGDCVEVAACPAVIHVRDSKDKAGPQLALSPAAWGEFVAYAGGGRG
ncbi:DUF397 domain-containing protein [Streptomyces sp. NBC_01431]|uniref:DUF397 domain-containing protein n=1 Tax=Streptomyces sp. NBC_01431 TaxID=2903863 RepID=UPI002E3438A0|nr:DUF397 domain-containing protein [Streptomyces sp. NBC_01431]